LEQGARARQRSALALARAFWGWCCSSLRSRWLESSTMTNHTTLFPHERLVAYQVACELLELVRELRISDAKLRDQCMRAAQSSCLNIAEAAGRFGGPDKARVFAIARGEACQVGAAVDIAARSRQCEQQAAHVASAAARRL
jgi:four helix bundle protein